MSSFAFITVLMKHISECGGCGCSRVTHLLSKFICTDTTQNCTEGFVHVSSFALVVMKYFGNEHRSHSIDYVWADTCLLHCLWRLHT